MIDIDLNDIPRDRVTKLMSVWEHLYDNCQKEYRRKPNEYLDGFMSAVDNVISDLDRLLEGTEDEE